MPIPKLNYPDEKDGCIYYWDVDKRKWMKICPVDKLPFNIRKQVLEAKIEAEALRDVEIP